MWRLHQSITDAGYCVVEHGNKTHVVPVTDSRPHSLINGCDCGHELIYTNGECYILHARHQDRDLVSAALIKLFGVDPR